MDDIDIYRSSSLIMQREVPPKIYSWITITLISFIVIGLLSIFVRYRQFIMYEAVINEGAMEFYVGRDFFDFKTKKVKIKDELYSYKLKTVEPYIYKDREIEYWKIVIEADIPVDWIIDNNYVEIHFDKGRTTILKEFIKLIKKGLKK